MMQILHWVLKMIVDPLCQWHSSQQCPISSPNSLSTAQSSPNHTGFPEKVIDIKLISNGQPSYPHIALVHTYSWNPCSRWNFLHKLSVEASQQHSHPRLRRLHDSWFELNVTVRFLKIYISCSYIFIISNKASDNSAWEEYFVWESSTRPVQSKARHWPIGNRPSNSFSLKFSHWKVKNWHWPLDQRSLASAKCPILGQCTLCAKPGLWAQEGKVRGSRDTLQSMCCFTGGFWHNGEISRAYCVNDTFK